MMQARVRFDVRSWRVPVDLKDSTDPRMRKTVSLHRNRFRLISLIDTLIGVQYSTPKHIRAEVTEKERSRARQKRLGTIPMKFV